MTLVASICSWSSIVANHELGTPHCRRRPVGAHKVTPESSRRSSTSKRHQHWRRRRRAVTECRGRPSRPSVRATAHPLAHLLLGIGHHAPDAVDTAPHLTCPNRFGSTTQNLF